MKTTPSTATATDPGQAREHDRDRELVRAITDALVLAVGKRAAHQALRHAHDRHHRAAQRRAVQAAALLAGYSALIGYIWRQRRAAHHAAA
jgi:hypothetical protein